MRIAYSAIGAPGLVEAVGPPRCLVDVRRGPESTAWHFPGSPERPIQVRPYLVRYAHHGKQRAFRPGARLREVPGDAGCPAREPEPLARRHRRGAGRPRRAVP